MKNNDLLFAEGNKEVLLGKLQIKLGIIKQDYLRALIRTGMRLDCDTLFENT